MKEQLINVETAKLAKEKEFNNGCHYLHGEYDGYIGIHNIDNFNQHNNEKQFSAPTQALLQKWLWEKQNLWVSSTPIFSTNECLGVVVSISSWRLLPTINVEYNGFDIYEGLEKGLYEALKLIKI